MNKLKEVKGITLVALVVTIIVLIILAGVSISLIMGQDGVVQKAKQGRDNYADAARLENEQLANVDAFALTIGDETSTPTEPEEPEPPVDTNKYIKFSDNTQEAIGGEESLKAKYGTAVHTDFFTSNQGSNWNWQLFYDDSKYIFLIASDYVTKATAPVYNNGNTNPNVTYGNLYNNASVNSTYNFTFCSDGNYNNYVLYTGTLYKAGAGSSPILNNPLTSTYLRWVEKNPNSTNYNIQAVSFMMDTNKWSQFAGTKYENSFAIGGPTTEMFTKSWNAYPGNSNKLPTYTMTSGTDYNSNGYLVGRAGNTSNWYANAGSSNNLGSSTNMWCRHDTGKAYGMWMASPSSNNSGQVIVTYYDGYLYCRYIYDTYYGFRPVVAIPKASI